MLDQTVFQTQYHEIKAGEIERNVFSLIGSDWLLVTGGDREKFNSMTVSWGGMGVLWNKNVAFIFIRRTRYTLEFIEKRRNFHFRRIRNSTAMSCSGFSEGNPDATATRLPRAVSLPSRLRSGRLPMRRLPL